MILSILLSYGFLIADPCFAAMLSILRLSSCVFLQNAFLDTLLVRMCRIFGRVEKLLIFPILWTSILFSMSLFCWRIYTDRIIMVSTKVIDLLGMLVMRAITLYIYTDIGQVMFSCDWIFTRWSFYHTCGYHTKKSLDHTCILRYCCGNIVSGCKNGLNKVYRLIKL